LFDSDRASARPGGRHALVAPGARGILPALDLRRL